MTYSTKELQAQKVDPWVLQARKWRRAHNLRLPEFAAMVDISRDHWNQIEVGKRRPSAKLRERVDVMILRWRGK